MSKKRMKDDERALRDCLGCGGDVGELGINDNRLQYLLRKIGRDKQPVQQVDVTTLETYSRDGERQYMEVPEEFHADSEDDTILESEAGDQPTDGDIPGQEQQEVDD